MSERGWQREFEDPILLPDGTQLKTLREAIAYLAKAIPKAERDMPEVMTAAEMLTNAAERESAWVFSRAPPRSRPFTATRFGCSIQIGKIIIGGNAS